MDGWIPLLYIPLTGSSYWTPPVEALESLGREISSNPVINKYSYILGLPSLRSHLSSMMGERGLSMLDMDIAVTAGRYDGQDYYDNAIYAWYQLQ